MCLCVLSFEEKKRVYILKNLHLTEEKCEREIEVVDIWKHTSQSSMLMFYNFFDFLSLSPHTLPHAHTHNNLIHIELEGGSLE